jgi:hypothetical protein
MAFIGEPLLDVKQQGREVAVVHVLFGEEIREQAALDRICQAPAVRLDRSITPGVDRRVATLHLGCQVRRVDEWLGILNAQRMPVAQVRLLKIPVAVVDVEEIVALDVEDNRHDLQGIRVRRLLGVTATGFMQKLMDNEKQEARLGAAAGSSVNVEVTTVLAQEIIEVNETRASQDLASIFDQPYRQGIDNLIAAVGLERVLSDPKQDLAPFVRRSKDGWLGAQNARFSEGNSVGTELRFVPNVAVEGVEFLTNVGAAALAIDLSDDGVEPDAVAPDGAGRRHDLGLLDELFGGGPEMKRLTGGLALWRRGNPADNDAVRPRGRRLGTTVAAGLTLLNGHRVLLGLGLDYRPLSR